MKQRDGIKRSGASGDERGSALLSMLAVGGVIAITVVSILSAYSSRQKLQAHAQAMNDARNLETSVRMVFSAAANCKTNIAGGGFGGNVSDLKNPANKNYNLTYNLIGGASLKLAAGTSWERLNIRELSFEGVFAVDGALSSLVTLRIKTSDIYGVALKDLLVPFYFVTDAGGALQECLATSFPRGPETHVTMEDMLCQQMRQSADGYFSPKEHVCAINPLILGARL
jgi:hypothetical protein